MQIISVLDFSSLFLPSLAHWQIWLFFADFSVTWPTPNLCHCYSKDRFNFFIIYACSTWRCLMQLLFEYDCLEISLFELVQRAAWLASFLRCNLIRALSSVAKAETIQRAQLDRVLLYRIQDRKPPEQGHLDLILMLNWVHLFHIFLCLGRVK